MSSSVSVLDLTSVVFKTEPSVSFPAVILIVWDPEQVSSLLGISARAPAQAACITAPAASVLWFPSHVQYPLSLLLYSSWQFEACNAGRVAVALLPSKEPVPATGRHG